MIQRNIKNKNIFIIATLKFATRAKKIKNNYKMNIKNSPEAL